MQTKTTASACQASAGSYCSDSATGRTITRAKKPPKPPISLSAQLQAAFAEHARLELPHNKNRSLRRGDRLPLSAWMQSAINTKASSPINAVTSFKAPYPSGPVGNGARSLSQRIARRYQFTWLQYELLSEYVYRRYRGNYSLCGWFVGGFDDCDLEREHFPRSIDAVRKAMKKAQIKQLPLRAIIDPNVTNIILMLQLESKLVNMRKRA